MILEATAMTLKDCEGHLVSSYLQVQTFQLIRGVFSGGGGYPPKNFHPAAQVL